MADAMPAELRAKVLDRIDDEEVVDLARDLIRIPSFTTEETPLAEWLASYLADQGLAVTMQETLRLVTGAEPEHFGVRLPQSYAGNDTTHLWAADIPCCLYGPGGGYTDYHDVHVDLEDLFLCTRVLALTALDATH